MILDSHKASHHHYSANRQEANGSVQHNKMTIPFCKVHLNKWENVQ